jgi:glutamate 5-kinase
MLSRFGTTCPLLASTCQFTMTPSRPSVADAHSVVIKVGTRVLTDDRGVLVIERLSAIADAAARLHAQGRDVLIVSSGAIGLGAEPLGLARVPAEADERQACAAVGQSRLVGLWQQALGAHGVACAQLLLTEGDFDARDRYLNLRAVFEALLRHRVVPVINENDAVSIQELALTLGPRPVFGDNDRLSALVASKLTADLLVLLTDVDGVFDRDPRSHADARLITRFDSSDEGAEGIEAGESVSGGGRGGMRSKVAAATLAARAGCDVIVASGRDPEALSQALTGAGVGTWFPASGQLSSRQRWIAFAAAARGTLQLDAGAVRALRDQNASLLAAGVQTVGGNFRAGDVVDLVDAEGCRIARGRLEWDAATVRAWCAGSPPPGLRNAHALIRRDDIVLEPS